MERLIQAVEHYLSVRAEHGSEAEGTGYDASHFHLAQAASDMQAELDTLIDDRIDERLRALGRGF